MLTTFWKQAHDIFARQQASRDLIWLCLLPIAVEYVFASNQLGEAVLHSLPYDFHRTADAHFFTLAATTAGLLVFGFRRWRENTQRDTRSRYEAQHDIVTGILNRRGFLAELLRVCTRGNQLTCILFDLDGFKLVNDTYGHPAGDALLQTIPDRVSGLLPEGSIFARLSGDEFAAVIPTTSEAQVAGIAKDVLSAISEPYNLAGKRVRVGTSIGFARFPADATDSYSLLQKADLALYRSKQSGRGRISAYDHELDAVYRRRAQLEIQLRSAIAENRIVPHYQPLVNVNSSALIGFEVLARWTDEVLGEIPPGEFIPFAVELGLIAELSDNLMRQALLEANAWDPAVRLSFNVAPQHLGMADFSASLLALIDETSFNPGRVDIEITEENFISRPEIVHDVVFTLKQHGITFSLDDFGVGYSSFGHLQSIPFDTIKIDRSFVQRAALCSKSKAILDSIIRLGHSVGTNVLAEGIETAAERELVTKMGCDLGQGWIYGRPTRLPDFTLANVTSLLPFRARAVH